MFCPLLPLIDACRKDIFIAYALCVAIQMDMVGAPATVPLKPDPDPDSNPVDLDSHRPDLPWTFALTVPHPLT